MVPELTVYIFGFFPSAWSWALAEAFMRFSPCCQEAGLKNYPKVKLIATIANELNLLRILFSQLQLVHHNHLNLHVYQV